MIVVADELTEEQKKGIWELVKEADDEFVPALSSRGSTTQKKMTGTTENKEPVDYFKSLLSQRFILTIEENKVVGFLSYIPDYNLDNHITLLCDYISTIIVQKEHRRNGYTTQMYKALMDHRKGRTIATRTWSLNSEHISLLNRLGFNEVLRLKDDRGEGIDTVYYSKTE